LGVKQKLGRNRVHAHVARWRHKKEPDQAGKTRQREHTARGVRLASPASADWAAANPSSTTPEQLKLAHAVFPTKSAVDGNAPHGPPKVGPCDDALRNLHLGGKPVVFRRCGRTADL